jgi:hypothetical protein
MVEITPSPAYLKSELKKCPIQTFSPAWMGLCFFGDRGKVTLANDMRHSPNVRHK